MFKLYKGLFVTLLFFNLRKNTFLSCACVLFSHKRFSTSDYDKSGMSETLAVTYQLFSHEENVQNGINVYILTVIY